MCHWCSYHILTSSVIYYWTDALQHGIYLFYIIKQITTQSVCLFQNTAAIQNEVTSLVAMRSTKLWLVQENHTTVKPDSSVSPRGIENLQRKQNWAAKAKNFEENAGKVKSVFVIKAAMWAEKLGRCTKYCRSWENILGKLAVAVNLEAIWFEFWMKGALVTVEMFCLLWLVILKSVWYNVGDTF